jgi:uncharacterized membrane protein
MKTVYAFLTLLFGSIMILAGCMHFIKPHVYDNFIPDFMPKVLVNYITGIVEIFIGIGTVTKKFRKQATLALVLLMIAFLPLHTIDLFKEQPAIGSHLIAVIRFPIQFILIGWAWFIHVQSKHAALH